MIPLPHGTDRDSTLMKYSAVCGSRYWVPGSWDAWTCPCGQLLTQAKTSLQDTGNMVGCGESQNRDGHGVGSAAPPLTTQPTRGAAMANRLQYTNTPGELL